MACRRLFLVTCVYPRLDQVNLLGATGPPCGATLREQGAGRIAQVGVGGMVGKEVGGYRKGERGKDTASFFFFFLKPLTEAVQ